MRTHWRLIDRRTRLPLASWYFAAGHYLYALYTHVIHRGFDSVMNCIAVQFRIITRCDRTRLPASHCPLFLSRSRASYSCFLVSETKQSRACPTSASNRLAVSTSSPVTNCKIAACLSTAVFIFFRSLSKSSKLRSS